MAITRLNNIPLGFVPYANVATNSFALDATNDWGAFAIYLPKACTISEISIWITGVTGTLAAGDITLSLYTNSANAPNTIIGSAFSLSAAPTTAQIIRYTGISYSYSAGEIVWAVLKNTNGTPGSNFVTLSRGSADTGTLGSANSTSGAANFAWRQSTDGGGSWASFATGIVGILIKDSDGDLAGFLPSSAATSAAADGVYAAREVGSNMTLPGSGFNYNVRGVIHRITTDSGTPTQPMRARIYNHATGSLLGTTNSIAQVPTSTTISGLLAFYFSSNLSIAAGTKIRVVLGEETQSDTSGNRYNSQIIVVPNDTDARNAIPYSMEKTILDGTWSDTAGELTQTGVILDGDNPVSASAGGDSAFVS